MSKASDLIERMEHETGQRIDDDNSLAAVSLLGAVARLMGKSSHQRHDDIVAGTLIQHQVGEWIKPTAKSMAAESLQADSGELDTSGPSP